MRKAFAGALLAAAAADERVRLLTADLGFGLFDEFRRRFPRRYLNVGIAEAQLISMAAGMAREGLRPVAYSIAAFLTARAFEQVKLDIAYPGLPVVLAGAGGGFVYGPGGVTHHAPDDAALMGLLPGMSVILPSGPREVASLMPQLLAHTGPAYLRLGMYGEPDLPLPTPPNFGRACRVADGGPAAVLTTGTLLGEALAAWRLLATEGNAPALWHFPTLKPLDDAALTQAVTTASVIIVAEECVPAGGLAAAVAARLAAGGGGPHLVRLGPADAFQLGAWSEQSIRRKNGYDAAGIAAACRAAQPAA